ncbi:MAG: response regulator [Ruminococcus sp.]|nr:response regulator [Ruminococcus sp.]
MKTSILGAVLIALILICGTLWTGHSAKRDTESAVRSVSLLYLDELAGRREQVVSQMLSRNVSNIRVAISLMTDEDLSDVEHLMVYQARMKKLYSLEKFAFVDTNGLIYTSLGTKTDIDRYAFDYQTLTDSDISIKVEEGGTKKVVIAVPVDRLNVEGNTLVCCFMEIDMSVMLEGVSLQSDNNNTTFCNIYTKDGTALTDMVLGGHASEDNLLTALEHASFEDSYSYGKVQRDFEEHEGGVAAFTYDGVQETLSYAPIRGTDWMLTYLIRETVISDKISTVSNGIIMRSLVQTLLTAAIMFILFMLMFGQTKRAAKLELEKETAETESRVKQQELEQRIALQEQLIEQGQALSDALTAAEEASKAKTVFLSNMSHEIRTPMNAIIGLDNIALSDPELSPKTREYLEKIDGSAQHLLALINDILDMSRIESGRMVLRSEDFALSKLLEQVNTIFSGQCMEKGLQYNCKINGEIDEHYIGDDMKLRQILINILGNAVKFTPKGGSVELAVERISQFNKQTALRFTITDTGVGISKEFMPHLFDTFAQEDSSMTNKYGSSGLGLAITKNIVEMMNGNIEVQSEKGKGTTFTVTVTLTASEHRDIGDGAAELQPHDMSVLVIDDDPVACEHAKLVLEKTGISCETALSGEKAIEMVKLRRARQEPYNLILVDLKMPDMDGVETTRRIRSVVGHESAIIIITAYRWDDVVEDAEAAGVDSFIAKPLFASNVIEEFGKALKRKRISAQQNEHRAELKGRHILLAEDVEINAEIMKTILKMREMEVDHAWGGREVTEMFAEKPAGYYDAILMDIRMPEMDGLEATSIIRAMDRSDAKTVPIIALTANAFDEDVQRSLQAGMNAHLTKPVEAPLLYETLENLIRD